MERKVFLTILTIALCVCLFAICASAAVKIGDETNGYVYYDLSKNSTFEGYDGTATVSTENRTSTDTDKSTHIVIPEVVEYDSDADGILESYVVTAVASQAFGKNGTSDHPIVSVVVPKTVATIGEHAFRGLSSLETVVIKAQGYNPVTGETSEVKFNNAEFYSTKSLVSVDMSESAVTKVGSVCFSYCSALESVKFSPSIKEIGFNAFVGCSSLATISSLETVTTLGEKAFQGCPIAQEIKLSSLQSIGLNAFQSTAITGVDFTGAPITSISSNAFHSCSKLVSVILPSGLEEIGSSAFYSCTALTSANIPDGVLRIKNAAFEKCAALTNTTIPSSVQEIGNSAFFGPKFAGDLVLPNISSLGNSAIRATNVTSIDFTGSTFTTVGEYCFYQSPSLETVILPSTVTEIKTSAFCQCTALTNVTVPSTLEILATNAFYQSPKVIGDFAFNSLSSIGENALRGTSITSVDFTGSTFTTLSKHQFRNCASLKSVVLPATLEEIPDGSFCQCTSLTSVNIPSSVKIFGSEAFYGSKIEGIVIIDYLESINKDSLRGTNITCFVAKDGSSANMGVTAFYGCTKLKCVVMPSSVTSISDNSFTNCSSLECIVASNSLATVSSIAFANCQSFNSIIVAGDDISTISTVFSEYTSAPFSEFDPSNTATKTIYYGAIATDDATIYASFIGFDKPFSAWDATTNTQTVYDAVVEALGYSTKGDGKGIATGFKINQESVDVYKSIFGSDITFGIVIFNPSFIGDTFFDANGKINASNGAIQVETIEKYSTISASVVGFDLTNEAHQKLELVFAGYAYSKADKSDIDLFQKEYTGTQESPVFSPMQSKVVKGIDVLYTVKLQTVTTPVEITTGKDGLNAFGA